MKKFKRKPSAYQKQIRFFTVMSVLAAIVVILVIMVLVNHSAFPTH